MGAYGPSAADGFGEKARYMALGRVVGSAEAAAVVRVAEQAPEGLLEVQVAQPQASAGEELLAQVQVQAQA